MRSTYDPCTTYLHRLPFFLYIYIHIYIIQDLFALPYQINNTMATELSGWKVFPKTLIKKVSNSSIVLMLIWCSLWRESSELVCCMRYTYDPCTTYLHRLPFFLYMYIHIYIIYRLYLTIPTIPWQLTELSGWKVSFQRH